MWNQAELFTSGSVAVGRVVKKAGQQFVGAIMDIEDSKQATTNKVAFGRFGFGPGKDAVVIIRRVEVREIDDIPDDVKALVRAGR